MASGFKIASAYVEVKADADGLRAEVRRDVIEAGVGQDVKVGVKVDNDRGLTLFDGLLKKVTASAKDMALSLVKGVSSVGAVGSTALTVAPAVASAVKWVVDLGSAAVQASPALLAIAAGGALVKLTMDQIGPAIVKQLSPISDSFKHAGEQASALAIKGIRPLAQDFARLDMPIISSGMDRIAESTRRVVERFLTWASTSAGIEAIRNTVNATSSAVEKIGPHISRFVASLGNMIGRIAGVSLAAGANGLSGVLEKLVSWMDRVNAATVRHGLDDMIGKYHQVRDAIEKVIGWVRQAIDFWNRYRTEIKLVQDALSILAIAFGGPVVAVVAAVGIIIRHWDQLKVAWQGVVNYFNSAPGTRFMDDLKSASASLVPALERAWAKVRAAVGPVLEEIWGKITNQLIPALGDLIAAVAPVVAWFVDRLAPGVAGAWAAIGSIISGAITLITGIIQVFIGLLTGNWTTAWEGVKNIVSGAWQIIKGLIATALNDILALFGTSLDQIKQKATDSWNSVKQTVSSALDSIKSAVSSAANSVMSTLSNAWNSARNTAVSAWNSIVSAVQGAVNTMLGVVRGIPGAILGALGNLGSLLYQAGVNVIQGLINGIRSMIGAVGSAISSIASTVRGALPFSPAKWGPLSGSGSPDIAGAKIGEMVAGGLHSSVGLVTSASSRLASAASIGGSASVGAGVGGSNGQAGGRRGFGPVTINVTQLAGSPSETGRYVALALRTVG